MLFAFNLICNDKNYAKNYDKNYVKMFIKFLENLLLIRTIAFHRKQNFAGRILKIFLFKCEKIKMATKYLSISKKKKIFL